MKTAFSLMRIRWIIALFCVLAAVQGASLAYAADTDCSADLDQAGTTYDLTTDVVGNCVITADNVVLDGQDTYSIDGEIISTGQNLTIQNIVSVTSGITASSTTIINSTIESPITTTDLSVEDSTISGGITADGDLSITDSVAGSSLQTLNGHSIALTESTVEASITFEAQGSGAIEIVRSTINGGKGGTITGGAITITDSVITESVVYGATLDLTDNEPTLTVTPIEVRIGRNATFDTLFGTVSASDVKDGDLTDNIEITGTVGDTSGEYELVYAVTDNGTTVTFNDDPVVADGVRTVSVTRIITREGSNSESTRVGKRSSRVDEEDDSTAGETVAETLERLRVVLDQPVTTKDPAVLRELLSVLLELVKVISQLLVAQAKI